MLKEYLSDTIEKFKHIDLRGGILCLNKYEDGITLFGISLIEHRTVISVDVEKIMMELKANEFLMELLGVMDERLKK